MSSVIHLVYGLNHRLEICGQWIVEHLHISSIRENISKSKKGGFTLVELMHEVQRKQQIFKLLKMPHNSI